jgi:hypothetical protein
MFCSRCAASTLLQRNWTCSEDEMQGRNATTQCQERVIYILPIVCMFGKKDGVGRLCAALDDRSPTPLESSDEEGWYEPAVTSTTGTPAVDEEVSMLLPLASEPDGAGWSGAGVAVVAVAVLAIGTGRELVEEE